MQDMSNPNQWMTELEELVIQAEGKFLGCRQWIYSPYFEVYVRVTTRYINGSMKDTIDVATIEVREEHQNRGYATAIFEYVEKLAKKYNRTVFVENVLSEILDTMLGRRGYTKIDGIPPSYYLRQ